MFNAGIIKSKKLSKDNSVVYYVGLKGTLRMKMTFGDCYWFGGMAAIDSPHSVGLLKSKYTHRIAVSVMHKNPLYNQLVFNAYVTSPQYDKNEKQIRDSQEIESLRNAKPEISVKLTDFGFVGIICNKKFPTNLRKIIVENNEFKLVGAKHETQDFDYTDYYGENELYQNMLF